MIEYDRKLVVTDATDWMRWEPRLAQANVSVVVVIRTYARV